ncbi:hypothetical protein [Psychromonas aquimarina]|uniref:hypothetical protein n=1 Tax=Psychromonas aquimarina TaxID=444919 RepID=UPI0004919571|nr:hypothetical protein [Psychromonas aquimarina]
MKTGLSNTGSGTTVTLLDHPNGEKLVTFCDNADPQTSVYVYKGRERSSPLLVGSQTLFQAMRSTTETSMIGYGNRIAVSSNFGHTRDSSGEIIESVSNESGITCLEVNEACDDISIIWEVEQPINTIFGIPQLARENGVIYSCSMKWHIDTTESLDQPAGYENYVTAYDSWNGRIKGFAPIPSKSALGA